MSKYVIIASQLALNMYITRGTKGGRSPLVIPSLYNNHDKRIKKYLANQERINRDD